MNAKLEHLKICARHYATAREAYYEAPLKDNSAQWEQLCAAARVLSDNVLESGILEGGFCHD